MKNCELLLGAELLEDMVEKWRLRPIGKYAGRELLAGKCYIAGDVEQCPETNIGDGTE